jgi:hypothetical protein
VRHHCIFSFISRCVYSAIALNEEEKSYREQKPSPSHLDPFALNPHLPLITLLRVTIGVRNFQKTFSQFTEFTPSNVVPKVSMMCQEKISTKKPPRAEA